MLECRACVLLTLDVTSTPLLLRHSEQSEHPQGIRSKWLGMLKWVVECGEWHWSCFVLPDLHFYIFFFFWKKGRNLSRAWCQPLRHALLSMMPVLAVFTVLLSSFAWNPTLVITSCLTDTGLCLKSFSLAFQFGLRCLFVLWILDFLPLSFTFQQSLPNYIRFF